MKHLHRTVIIGKSNFVHISPPSAKRPSALEQDFQVLTPKSWQRAKCHCNLPGNI
jgi:hypothetical protein